MLKKIVTIAAASGVALSLAGCTNAQEQDVLTGIQTACEILPVGTVFVVTFASSVSLTAPLAPIIQTIGTGAANDCNALYTAIQSVIESINGQGGTATVNVTSQSAPAAASLQKLSSKLSAKYHLKAVSTPKGVTFVVPPASPFNF